MRGDWKISICIIHYISLIKKMNTQPPFSKKPNTQHPPLFINSVTFKARSYIPFNCKCLSDYPRKKKEPKLMQGRMHDFNRGQLINQVWAHRIQVLAASRSPEGSRSPRKIWNPEISQVKKEDLKKRPWCSLVPCRRKNPKFGHLYSTFFALFYILFCFILIDFIN